MYVLSISISMVLFYKVYWSITCMLLIFVNFILQVLDKVQSIEHALFYWFGIEIM